MSEEKQNTLFRKQALEYISASQPLHDLIQMPGPYAWGWIILIWIILALVALWLIVSQIHSIVEGQGIVLENQKAIVFVPAVQGAAIQPGMSVIVSSIAFQPNMSRAKGIVTAVDYQAILRNQSLAVKISIDLSRASFRPGTLIRADVEIKKYKPFHLLMSERS
jgi:hypothetical protein